MIIERENELINYLKNLRSKKVSRLALDLEGDQGSFRYKYSVAIFQCFDGDEAVIIDVLKLGASETLKELLTCPDLIKVMFSCNNDLFITQNVLGHSIFPVRDIAIAQKLLGKKAEIASYIGIEKKEKDAFQRANWLKRPLKQDLIDYAIKDVLDLLRIEETLTAELSEKKLADKYIEECERLCTIDYRVNQLKQYADKFPGYRKLKSDKKKLARAIWIFRELLGERFDCPVGYILSKGSMLNIIKSGNTIESIIAELNRERREHKKIDQLLIEKLYKKAEEMAQNSF
ncbi:MAG TPA: hypothetical protein PKK26_01210 [Candidatus Wallbacteria bacterium]|nr:hypothetical protein [Candidatus Wallbacteria bacterium]